jgi:hypothetical protein
MRPISHAVPGALSELLRQAPVSPGKVDFAWKAAVGGAMQRVTRVRLEAGALIVDAANMHWAREIERARPTILPRLQTLLGKDVVARIIVKTPD